MYRIYKLGLYNKIIRNENLFLVGFFMFIVSGLLYNDYKNIFTYHGVDSFKYLIYIVFVLFLPLLFEQTKDNKADRYIGELSYPVYIVHIFVIMFVSKISNETYLSLLTIIVSIIFAIILNKFVQKKIERIRISNIKEVLND